ncbi:MAG: hypothetical protein WC781_02565 [Candidatus Pacearchaeota archaeon]
MISKNQAGLVFGAFIAGLHAIWTLMVAIMPGTLQAFLNWLFQLHSLTPYMQITTFNFVNAIFLVIITFIFGYIFGWLLLWIHQLIGKKVK